MIDLIPFGEIERNGQIYLEGNPPKSLSVFGNRDVSNHAQTVHLKDGGFKICTLPGLCVLKLKAFVYS